MKIFITLIALMVIQACSHTNEMEKIPMAENVDLNKFMGDWYVIANIPTFIEEGAHNAIENYAMNDDGTIATTFSFNSNGFDGELKVYEPTGFVTEISNSLWGMQFIWPFKAEFIIAYLSPDYQQTIIARNARDYVWIMARTPELSETSLNKLIKLTIDMGYDAEQIKLIPHKHDLADDALNAGLRMMK